MEPIVTLPYSEWLVAEHLMTALPSSEGYSVYAPLSRQEKGVDLLLTRRTSGTSRSATVQVKYSRAYEQRKAGAKFRFTMWFRSFPVTEQADFFVLAGLYPNVTGKGGGSRASWWLPLLLLFRREEMGQLISSLRSRRGAPERMFYFEFDSPHRVVLTRGAVEPRDITDFTFASRLTILQEFLSGR